MGAPALSFDELVASRREEIRECIARGEVERAVKRLLDFARELRNDVNTALLLAGQLSKYKQRERQQIAEERELLAITKAILEEADTMFEAWTAANGASTIDSANRSQDTRAVVRPLVQKPDVQLPTRRRQNRPTPSGERSPGVGSPPVGRASWKDFGQAPIRPICSAKGVQVAFGRRARHFELDRIDLEILPGQITGVVGSNGSGKTTMLRVIAGEIRPTSGELTYAFDHGRRHELLRDRIGYVEQSPSRWYGTVRANLARWCSLRGLTPDESNRRIQFILLRLGLDHVADYLWENLSGGFKMRFELARALLCMPRLLVLDEPLAPLDVRAQWHFLQDLRDIAGSRIDPVGILISSQHLDEIEAIADNLVAIDNGKVLFTGPVDLLGEERDENAFEIRSAGPLDQVERAARALLGCRIESAGRYLVLHTPRDQSGDAVLRALLDAKLDLVSFRDISRSSRRILFSQR